MHGCYLEQTVSIHLGIPRYSRLPVHQRRKSHTWLHTVKVRCNVIVDAEGRTQERHPDNGVSEHAAPRADLSLAPVGQKVD